MVGQPRAQWLVGQIARIDVKEGDGSLVVGNGVLADEELLFMTGPAFVNAAGEKVSRDVQLGMKEVDFFVVSG